MKILCKIGLHRWKFKFVKSKMPRKHLRCEKWNTKDSYELRHGRECKCCKKQQYMWMPWVNLYYFDVIKD